MKRLLILAIGAVLLTPSINAQNVNGISTERLKKHVETLAGEDYKGRGAGEKGEKKAAKYIIKTVKKQDLKPKGTDGYEQEFNFELKLMNPANPHGEMVDKGTIEAKNVVAYVDNAAEYTVIIGAHYDHLGEGHLGGSREAHPEGKVHFGADDNASGVAGLLELANYLQNNGKLEFHNYLFVFFSGEEEGLHGSKHFAGNPTIELESVNYMLNMDMIGRLDSVTKKLVVHGVGTNPEFGKHLQKANSTYLNLVYDSSGVGPSDFTSFYLKNIPVLGFFTGQHNDYHKSTDTPEKLNYAGEKEVLDMVIRLIERLDTLPKLEFTKTKDVQQGRTRFKVTLGIMPDYTYNAGGLRVDSVIDDKPAAKAGVQAGDIITGLNGKDIADMRSYMQILGELEPGTTTSLIVKRGGEDLTLEISFPAE